MADQDDVRRIALTLPDVTESDDHFGFSVRNGSKQKQFAWAWNERVDPKKPRVPRADVVAIRVEDAAPNGYTLDRATVRQRKTGRPVRFEMTEQTRQAVDDYLRECGRKTGQFLFAGRGPGDRGLTTRQYARLVGDWVSSIGLVLLRHKTRSSFLCPLPLWERAARWFNTKKG